VSEAGEHERLAGGVFLVGGAELSDDRDCLVYAVDLGDLVLVDCGAGPGWPQIRANVRSAGLDPARVHTLVLTHAHIDHAGAAAQVAAETGCRVVAHALDTPTLERGDPIRSAAGWYGLELAPVKVDLTFEGAELGLAFARGTLQLLHTPGHTPGSLVVLLDGPDGRVLFAQDVHGPFAPDFGSDLEAWRRSMDRLLALEADLLCEGHFGVFRGRAAVRRYLESQLAAHR
jgi:glyoxylase-like metal-dependent hydrolase (beta-lactamase superfamily II)